jgi:anti-sigma B factor antagonist
MKINKKQDGNSLKIELEGRLDTTTAPELDEAVKSSIDGVTDLVFDMTGLEYISSAGLRVLLSAQKAMGKVNGNMVVKNINDVIQEIFEVTGFIDIFTVE